MGAVPKMEKILEFSKNTPAALEGVKYQPIGPKFIYVVEGRRLRNST